MGNIVRRLTLGTVLIALASGVLLWTDTGGGSSIKKPPGAKVRLAILQHASTPVLEDGVRGMIDGLAEKGWREGDNLTIRRFNAEGDVTTSNSIAQEIVNGPYDMVLTSSTPSMQAVATANRAGRVLQVFTLVADPFSAGVGLTRDDPAKHPRQLVGLGIRVAITEAIRSARKLNPDMKRIGMVWNPGESNSHATMRMARDCCKEDGIELLEANAENTSGVADACDSLIARGAQAIFVGGDNTVVSAIAVVIDRAKKASIPVISALPNMAKPDRGTLLDVGTDFYAAGKLSGLLAADILNGTDPATIPIRDSADLAPLVVIVNKKVAGTLKESWRVPDEFAKSADTVVDQAGVHQRDKK